MFCKECGSKVKKDAKFCENCGTKVATEEAVVGVVVDTEQEDNDEKLPFGGTVIAIATASTPVIAIVNIFAGVVGFIWLAILGQWIFAIAWFLGTFIFMWVYSFVFAIFQGPFLWLAGMFIEKKHKKSFLVTATISLIIGYILNFFWIFWVFSSMLMISKDMGLLAFPFLLYGYSIAVAPFQSMAAGEASDALATNMAVWLLAFSYLLLFLLYYLNLLFLGLLIIPILTIMVIRLCVKVASLSMDEA